MSPTHFRYEFIIRAPPPPPPGYQVNEKRYLGLNFQENQTRQADQEVAIYESDLHAMEITRLCIWDFNCFALIEQSRSAFQLHRNIPDTWRLLGLRVQSLRLKILVLETPYSEARTESAINSTLIITAQTISCEQLFYDKHFFTDLMQTMVIENVAASSLTFNRKYFKIIESFSLRPKGINRK